MENFGKKRIIICAIALVVLLLSIFVVTPIASKPDTYQSLIEKLDEKQETVMKMAVSTAVASVGIGAVPGDATSPIANKVIDLSGYMIIVMVILIAEKYLLTIIGLAVFKFIVPAICILAIIYQFWGACGLKKLGIKLAMFSVAMLLIIPISVRVSGFIDNTYKDSIELGLSQMEGIQESLLGANEAKETEAAAETQAAAVEEETKEEKTGSWWSNLINDAMDKANDVAETVTDTISDAAATVQTLTAEKIDELQAAFRQMVEAVVILLVTNCVIPVAVLIFFWIIFKLILGVDLGGFSHRRHHHHGRHGHFGSPEETLLASGHPDKDEKGDEL